MGAISVTAALSLVSQVQLSLNSPFLLTKVRIVSILNRYSDRQYSSAQPGCFSVRIIPLAASASSQGTSGMHQVSMSRACRGWDWFHYEERKHYDYEDANNVVLVVAMQLQIANMPSCNGGMSSYKHTLL